jgi:hypothetical protein
MRRISLILVIVLITGLIIHDIYEFFVTNEGIRYFALKPMRLLYVMLLGISGGLVAFGISRFSPDAQRGLKLLLLGGVGVLLAVAVAFFGYQFYQLAVSGLPVAPLKWLWIAWAMAFVPIAAATAMVWLEFRRVWRKAR